MSSFKQLYQAAQPVQITVMLKVYLSDPQVVEQSQKLDGLLNTYYQLEAKRKTAFQLLHDIITVIGAGFAQRSGHITMKLQKRVFG